MAPNQTSANFAPAKPVLSKRATSRHPSKSLLNALTHLTTLGVGSTLGLGLYVLAGQVASNKAGPAVIISFGLAALASAFSALCYAEFAARVPRAGSAYVYSYITVGEFVAFIIGWNLILEYVIGASSVARGFSGYLRLVYEHASSSFSGPTQLSELNAITTLDDSAFGKNQTIYSSNKLQTLVNLANVSLPVVLAQEVTTGAAKSISTIDSIIEYATRYFDWPSIAIVLILTVFILFGVKESTNVNLLFTVVNLTVVLTVVLSSFGSLSLHNWQLTPEELPPGGAFGHGGFMPFGWSGVLAGSATCFFGFIGFDTIASSAEEAKNPKRNLPLSITLSLFISFIAYMLVAIVQTLLWPYYDQDKITILPYIFGKLGMPITYWIVLFGAVAGLAASQMGGMYPLPRILYSMAQDKLIYSQLGHVNKRLKLPVRATIVGAIFIALLACLLDIQDLADMVSIGTLAAYSLVSISVLLVRYETRRETIDDSSPLTDTIGLNDPLDTANDCHQLKGKNSIESTTITAVDDVSQQVTIVGGRDVCPKLATQEKSTSKAWLVDRTSSSMIEMNTDGCSSSNADSIQCSKRPRQRMLDLLIIWNDDAKQSQPDDLSCFHSKILIGLIVILSILIGVIVLSLLSGDCRQATVSDQQHALLRMINGQRYVSPETVLLCTGSIVVVTLIAVVLMLSRLPTGKPTHPDMFLVPFVPLIPTMSILVNTFLMLNLSYLTWIRFSVWMAAGFFIYFTYGIWNSEGYMLRIVSKNIK